MSRFDNVKKSSGQLRPVILLLAIAVILPTVCLLWFMTQAVKNERFAVRQKLIDVYSIQTDSFLSTINHLRDHYIKINQTSLETSSPEHIFNLAIDNGHPSNRNYWELANNDETAWVIYDVNGKLIYPVFDFSEQPPGSPALENAAILEYQKKDFTKALDTYQKISSDGHADPFISALAIMGKGRCLFALGDPEQSIDAFIRAAGRFAVIKTPQAETWQAMSKFRAEEIAFNIYPPGSKESIEAACDMLYQPFLRTNLSTKSFLLEKAISLIEPHIDKFNRNNSVRFHYNTAKRTLKAFETAAEFIERYPTINSFPSWQHATYHRSDITHTYYCQLYKTPDRYGLAIYEPEEVEFFFRDKIKDISKSDDILYAIYDDSSEILLGNIKENAIPFLSLDLNPYFAGWKLELYFKDNSVFDNAASRQTAIYTWTGVLVIVLILTAGGFAGNAINKQIKLNRLKNDFIATISHELKTPLSSMRVLVDTLLEGNYNDQQQATEYLQLISKENARLSRLIDNFLTFSRMERNKQVFDITPVSPVEIVNIAAQAVQAKFDKANVKFDLSVSKPLPMINTDKDAIVTVLINLLDNAYKYSYDGKQIQLKVFLEDNFVCFLVKDNGIGMTRRQTKRVFDRFYQADSSLTRSTNGTGLGLSIVKFIVTAHKGQITVESKPGKGSEFTIKMPIT